MATTTTATIQRSLFAGDGATRPSIERIHLGSGSWLDHAAGWVDHHDHLFVALLQALPWKHRSRPMYDKVVAEPRLTAAADPSALPLPAGQALRSVRHDLEERYGVPLDGEPWCNLYRTGADSVAWHGDRIGRTVASSIVAIVSLGAPRPFQVRPAAGGASLSFDLGEGHLMVMGGDCQRTHQHRVPKRAHVRGPRMSITWRWATDA